MKNAFKFGFLGLLFSVAFAACNTTTTSEAEQTGDSLITEIEEQVEATTDSIDSMGSEAIDSLDSLVN